MKPTNIPSLCEYWVKETDVFVWQRLLFRLIFHVVSSLQTISQAFSFNCVVITTHCVYCTQGILQWRSTLLDNFDTNTSNKWSIWSLSLSLSLRRQIDKNVPMTKGFFFPVPTSIVIPGTHTDRNTFLPLVTLKL